MHENYPRPPVEVPAKFWEKAYNHPRIYYPGKPIPENVWEQWVDQEQDTVYVLTYPFLDEEGKLREVPIIGLNYSRHEALEGALRGFGLPSWEEPENSFQIGVDGGNVHEITATVGYSAELETLALQVLDLCPFKRGEVHFNRFTSLASDTDPFGFDKVFGSRSITLNT